MTAGGREVTAEVEKVRTALERHLQECAAYNATNNAMLANVIAWQTKFDKRAWGSVAAVGGLILAAILTGIINIAVQSAHIPTAEQVAAKVPDRYTATDARASQVVHSRELKALRLCIIDHSKCKDIPDGNP